MTKKNEISVSMGMKNISQMQGMVAGHSIQILVNYCCLCWLLVDKIASSTLDQFIISVVASDEYVQPLGFLASFRRQVLGATAEIQI